MVMNPDPLRPAGAQPPGGVPANTSAEPFTPPDRTFMLIAASCADSMFAMFVAFAERIQVEKVASAVAQLPVSGTSKSDPFEFFKLSALRVVRHVGSLAHRMALPFLFDQKPSVSPPPAPRQTLPKVTVFASPHWICWLDVVDVVACQPDLDPSETVYDPAEIPAKHSGVGQVVKPVPGVGPATVMGQPAMQGSPVSWTPLALASEIATAHAVAAEGCVMLPVVVAVQPLASVTV